MIDSETIRRAGWWWTLLVENRFLLTHRQNYSTLIESSMI